jgi:hypothetical protein
MIAGVLGSLQPTEREVRDLEGRWYPLNIVPYRTQEDKIDGVVLALQDIHLIKTASEQLKQSAEFFRSVMNTAWSPCWCSTLSFESSPRMIHFCAISKCLRNRQSISSFRPLAMGSGIFLNCGPCWKRSCPNA